MHTSFSYRLFVLTACSLLVTLSGCRRPTEPVAEQAATDVDAGEQMEWARAALQRNPNVEIVATDVDESVFTLRDKRTNELVVLKLDELAAAPVAHLSAASTPVAAAPAAATPPAAPPAEPEPAALAGHAPPQPPAAASSPSEPSPASGYTIERSDGQVKVSGPGVSIVSTGEVSANTEGGTRRASDPIICEGRRMLQLDNRDIYVEGDAIIARGGCELYLTNSRIAASGTGVVVQDATVHISNSRIEGATASFSASDNARMFVRSSTFDGVSRRAERATIQDLGGNRW